MISKFTYYISFILLILFISSCEQIFLDSTDEPQLPPITMTGENTFGCLINGKLFRPSGSLIGAPFGTGINPRVSYNEASGGFKISASNKQSGYIFELIINQSINQPGIYKFTNISGYKNIEIWGCEIYTVIPESSHINLTKLDKENDIASGTFYGEFVNNCNDTLIVTEGRFDVEYTL